MTRDNLFTEIEVESCCDLCRRCGSHPVCDISENQVMISCPNCGDRFVEGERPFLLVNEWNIMQRAT